MRSIKHIREKSARSASRDWLIAWIWVGPAVVFVGVFLVWPVLNTLWLSLHGSDETTFVGLQNFKFIFTDPNTLQVLKNNLLWLVVGTAATVIPGAGHRRAGGPRAHSKRRQSSLFYSHGHLLRGSGCHLGLNV